jgi:1-acyl-sn-glycerol-3-phosphate acyltransferase
MAGPRADTEWVIGSLRDLVISAAPLVEARRGAWYFATRNGFSGENTGMSTQGLQLERDVALEQARELTRVLLTELSATHALSAVAGDAHLERDLGLGSLERVELIQRLGQAFDVSLPDQLAAQADTLNELVEAALRAAAAGARRSGENTEIFSAAMAAIRRPSAEPRGSSPQALHLESAETLNEVLKRHAKADAARPQIYLREDPAGGAAHAEPRLITYGDLHAAAQAVAANLLTLGLGPRQTVALMLPTSREFFFSFYGVLLAGGVPVPIYPPFRADRIEEYAARQAAILRNAEARILITFRQAETVARLLRPQVPSLTAVVNGERLLDAGSDSGPRKGGVYQPRAEDIAFIQYTSGSTGDPKGVALTHANLLGNMRAIAEAVDITPRDTGVSWLPLYHDMGLIGAWLTLLYCGAPLAVMSPLAFLTRPERWLWAFHHHRGTVAAAPNFAYELCVRKIADRDIEGLDLSSWRAALNGAEPIHPETLERFTERFAPYGFRREAMLPVYGLAEASLALTVPPLGRGPLVDRVDREALATQGRAVPVDGIGANALAFVSCGRAVPRHEVRIVDQHGNDAAERTEGRLWFRGPGATRGYYRNDAATQAIQRGAGWIDSGDRAYRVGDEVYITGRVKDIIIKAGRNLYPHEVEEVTCRAAGVRKGCVVAFGARDEKSGTERLVVVAETREKSPDEKTIAALDGEVTSLLFQALGLPPDAVELVPPGTIPKTSSGKLRRNETRRRYLAGELRKRQPPMLVQVARLGAASTARAAAGGLRRVFELLYGIYAYVAFAVFLLPTWTLAYLAPTRAAATRITQVGSRFFFRLAGIRIDIEGKEHFKGNLPYVLVSNHTSFLDVVLYLAILKFTYRFVSKIEVASWPFIGTFLNRRLDLRFKREDNDARLDQAGQLEKVLRDGESLLIFPEATFIAADGLRHFQMGAFRAAVTTGRPICPIALRGVRQIFRDETLMMRPGRIRVIVGPPLPPRTGPGVSAWSEMVRLRDATREFIGRHCGEPVL